MVALRTIGFHRFCESLRLQSTSNPLFGSTHQAHLSLCSIFQRNFSDIAQLVSHRVLEDQTEANPGVSGDGHVRLIESDEETEGFGAKSIKLESDLKGSSRREEGQPTAQSKPNSLYSLFSSKSERSNAVSEKYSTEKRKSQSHAGSVGSKSLGGLRPVAKELSPEMVSLISRFYEEGLLNDANFLPLKKLELSDLSNPYYRDFLMFTAERFGQDHQEIAKWLSGSHLKKVALFGCPSVEKKTTFAAKRLRSFFSIHEDTVCQQCKLKSSCKFVNKKVLSKVNNVNLADSMRVLTLYAMDSTPIQLVVPDEVKASVGKLLKEVINLSE